MRWGRLPATGRRDSALPGPEAKRDEGGSPERAQMGGAQPGKQRRAFGAQAKLRVGRAEARMPQSSISCASVRAGVGVTSHEG